MIPYLLALAGGYLIGSSMKDSYEDGGMMENGGGISEKTTYVPNRDVKELMVVLKGELTKLSGSDIVDGVYVKNKRGKGQPKKSASTSSVDVPKLLSDVKEYLKKEGYDETPLTEADIQGLIDCGFDETDIKVILFGYGYVFNDKIKCDNEFRGYVNGVIGSTIGYQMRAIENICADGKNGYYEMGMEYPSFKWDKIVSTFNVKSEPKNVVQDDYTYEVFLGDGVAFGHSIIYRGEEEGNKIGTLNLKKPNEYQKERDYKAGFNGGYWGVVVKDKKNLYKILNMLVSQNNAYLKNLEVFINGLGGIGVDEVEDLQFKYGGNC